MANYRTLFCWRCIRYLNYKQLSHLWINNLTRHIGISQQDIMLSEACFSSFPLFSEKKTLTIVLLLDRTYYFHYLPLMEAGVFRVMVNIDVFSALSVFWPYKVSHRTLKEASNKLVLYKMSVIRIQWLIRLSKQKKKKKYNNILLRVSFIN